MVVDTTKCSEARRIVKGYFQKELAFLQDYKEALERCAAYLDANLTLEGDHVQTTIRSFFAS